MRIVRVTPLGPLLGPTASGGRKLFSPTDVSINLERESVPRQGGMHIHAARAVGVGSFFTKSHPLFPVGSAFQKPTGGLRRLQT